MKLELCSPTWRTKGHHYVLITYRLPSSSLNCSPKASVASKLAEIEGPPCWWKNRGKNPGMFGRFQPFSGPFQWGFHPQNLGFELWKELAEIGWNWDFSQNRAIFIQFLIEHDLLNRVFFLRVVCSISGVHLLVTHVRLRTHVYDICIYIYMIMYVCYIYIYPCGRIYNTHSCNMCVHACSSTPYLGCISRLLNCFHLNAEMLHRPRCLMDTQVLHEFLGWIWYPLVN